MHSSGKLLLKFEIRLTNNNPFPSNFWKVSFLLLVDGVLQASSSDLNKLVECNSAMIGFVEFVIPDTAKTLALQVGQVEENAPAMPIALTIAQ